MFNDNLNNKDNLYFAYDATASTGTLIGRKKVLLSCPSCLYNN